MSGDRRQDAMMEALFSGALLSVALVLAAAAARIPDVEDTGLTSRALPLSMALAIAGFAAVRVVVLLRAVRGFAVSSATRDGSVLRIVLPLSGTMVVYALLLPVLGYTVTTILALLLVLWIFGVRGPLRVAVLATAAGIASHVVFERMLGLFMPEGWLFDALQRSAWSGVVPMPGTGLS